MFIRGCNLIDIADENRYLQNAWFALTGNLLNEEQMDRLIQIASIMSKHRAAPELGLLAFFVCRMPILLARYQARFIIKGFKRKI
ncbi:hypothetical protein [Bartonella vinsonii]|uniref:hypothetical protein n=1 Tax=Bartonella vinsonii TaxID=33047 RepID=UPI000315F328|nr:hypothetical protein [Bartonella vinsonii]